MDDIGILAVEPDDALGRLQQRLGHVHARQRLGLEEEHEARSLGRVPVPFSLETLTSSHRLIRAGLRLMGVYGRGRRNAAKVRLRGNRVISPRLPPGFDGYRILHLSDLHADMSKAALRTVARRVADLDYDLCVLTGDFRGRTFGPFTAALERTAELCRHLQGPVYGVLGNHDSLRMVPALEDMGIQMLMNEAVTLKRGGDELHLAGIDDAHFYRLDDIQKTAAGLTGDAYAILLSHTPEVYREAAQAGFDLLLCGHTHGGQLCLPGGIPLTLEARLPRALGAGAWHYERMAGYTSVGAGSSVVPARLNCPPEITLHELVRGPVR